MFLERVYTTHAGIHQFHQSIDLSKSYRPSSVRMVHEIISWMDGWTFVQLGWKCRLGLSERINSTKRIIWSMDKWTVDSRTISKNSKKQTHAALHMYDYINDISYLYIFICTILDSQIIEHYIHIGHTISNIYIYMTCTVIESSHAKGYTVQVLTPRNPSCISWKL